MEGRYVISDEIKKMMNIDDKISYGHSMSQPLSYDKNKFDKNVKIEDFLTALDHSVIGFRVEVD